MTQQDDIAKIKQNDIAKINTTFDPDAPKAARRFANGNEILGRYVVESELGQGGMGVVYKCFDKVGGVEVAVKGLPPEVSHNSDEMEAVRDNFQLVHELHHPNIASVLTLEQDAATGDYYLVMTLARGVSLRHWLRQHGGREHRDEQLNVLRQIASALDYAHNAEPKHIIHRDIKPENVMVDERGNVAVLDFGLAAQVRSSLSRVSQVVTSRSGTPAYKSPEQWLAQAQRAPSDQYSLGVIAYQMFAGELPFDSDDIEILKHAVVFDPVPEILGEGTSVNAAFAKVLAKKPQERFASCAAFVAALEGRRSAFDRAGLAPSARAASAHKSRLVAVLLGALAVGALAGIGWWWHGRAENEEFSVKIEPLTTEHANMERAAETSAYALSVELEAEAQRITSVPESVCAFFKDEIEAFERVRKAGDAAKADAKNVTATNFFVQAKARADALKRHIGEYDKCLLAKDRAEEAKRSADAVDAKTALSTRYSEAVRELEVISSLVEKRDFAKAFERAESARGRFAALRADVVKVVLGEANRHKADGRWKDCLVVAEKVLGWEPQNAEALLLKKKAMSHSDPTLRIVAKIGDREIAATFDYAGESLTTPYELRDDLVNGKSFPNSDIVAKYNENGKCYVGLISRMTVDWCGQKTFVVSLAEKRTETVNGVRWTFAVANGQATVGGDGAGSGVSDDVKGAIEIPQMLGGCTVTGIGADAFYSIKRLTSVTIPSGVTCIGDSAFACCDGLTSVTIPSSVTNIGAGAFMFCPNLTRIEVDPGNQFYLFLDGVLIDKVSKTFVTCPGGRRSVVIPSGITSIGRRAFVACKKLTSVAMPAGVTNIGAGAFMFCEGLTSVAIPSTVTQIGRAAFSGCSGLTSLTIPSGVTRIEGDAFEMCDGLTSVTIPSGVTRIEGNPFRGCESLMRIEVSSMNAVYSSQDGFLIDSAHRTLVACPGGIESVTIPSGVMCIGRGALSGCNMSSVTIPSCVTNIGRSAFLSCERLKSVTIPLGVRGIGEFAFYNCRELRSVTIPASVKSIGRSAFYFCRSLASVMIPSSVTGIEGNPFSSCVSLRRIEVSPENKSYLSQDGMLIDRESKTLVACPGGIDFVVMPSDVMRIGECAFEGCSRLTSATIPPSVTSVGRCAFNGCDGLTDVTLPSSVKRIGGYAFSACSRLKTVRSDDPEKAKELMKRCGVDVERIMFKQL